MLQGDQQAEKVVDNRQGVVAPAAPQRTQAAGPGVAARFNDLGTPAVLTGTTGPLATGLPADPVAAATAYVEGNRDVLGLTESGAAALEVVGVNPIGDGAAVLFRQRFGDLVAGYDGLLAVGVRGGEVWHVTSSLAQDAAAPEPATLSEDEAIRIALADAGVDAADTDDDGARRDADGR